MYVKNTSKKVIGFRDLALLPGEADELPEGYSENHPTVKYYLSIGWLTVTTKEAVMAAKEPVQEPVTENKPPELTEAEKVAKAGEELGKRLKEVSKMSLDLLRATAAELDVEFDDLDTKAVLCEKITAKLQAV